MSVPLALIWRPLVEFLAFAAPDIERDIRLFREKTDQDEQYGIR